MFSDLPPDLESEILSRVPATSLSQLRSTCKRWYALFKDPKFIKKNSGKAAREVILKKDHRVYSVSINLHGISNSFDPSFEFIGKLNSLDENLEDVKVSEISECDGLLLCTTNDKRLVVLNPCTGQTRWIQPRNRKYRPRYKYFLGCENNSRSYKILRLGHYVNVNLAGAELYEFNSDSWKALDDFTPNCSIESNGVTLKGNTYWFASEKKDPLVKFILRFDFTTERFERLSLPFHSDCIDEIVVLSVVREEKLALLHQNFDQIDSLEMKIWVTDTKIDEAKDLSWSNFLVVDFGKFMITNMFDVMSFLVDEENKMVVCSDTDITKNGENKIYIVGQDVRKQVYEESTSKDDSLLLLSYVPSLVQIPAR